MKNYLSVFESCEYSFTIEHSRFIGYSCHVETEEEARAFLASIKKDNSLATHNCYAYVTELGKISRFSDDGEPSGTAGQPILEAIKNANLVDTIIVVTRYFGGIKLGTGGLVRAYTQAAMGVIEKTIIEKYCMAKRYLLKTPYDKLDKVNVLALKNYVNIENTNYSDIVEETIFVKHENEQAFLLSLSELFSGKAEITYLSDGYMKSVYKDGNK